MPGARRIGPAPRSRGNSGAPVIGWIAASELEADGSIGGLEAAAETAGSSVGSEAAVGISRSAALTLSALRCDSALGFDLAFERSAGFASFFADALFSTFFSGAFFTGGFFAAGFFGVAVGSLLAAALLGALPGVFFAGLFPGFFAATTFALAGFSAAALAGFFPAAFAGFFAADALGGFFAAGFFRSAITCPRAQSC